jgi:hypothetical protein
MMRDKARTPQSVRDVISQTPSRYCVVVCSTSTCKNLVGSTYFTYGSFLHTLPYVGPNCEANTTVGTYSKLKLEVQK